jgi:hypothetical protein
MTTLATASSTSYSTPHSGVIATQAQATETGSTAASSLPSAVPAQPISSVKYAAIGASIGVVFFAILMIAFILIRRNVQKAKTRYNDKFASAKTKAVFISSPYNPRKGAKRLSRVAPRVPPKDIDYEKIELPTPPPTATYPPLTSAELEGSFPEELGLGVRCPALSGNPYYPQKT